MRREIELWWKQSEADFDTANKNFQVGCYYSSVFFCQQSLEKGLKALFILKKGESSGTTHSLIFLSTETKVPSKFLSFLRSITSEYINTRYPDIGDSAPYERYDKQIAEETINKTEEVIEWIRNQIEKQ